MQVEVWSDFAWPFCYIGKKHLEDAIKQIGQPVEVIYRCFELDPTRERDSDETIYEHLAKKYGMSIEQAKANTENVVRMAQQAGLQYNMDSLILTNTFDAHRLTMYAKTQGLMEKMAERIFRAYFTESKHIGRHEVLVKLAEEVGLNREAVEKMLASDQMTEAVRKDEQTAQQYGITGVPFFLINKKYALTGAQPIGVFVQAFEKVMAEDRIVPLNSQNGMACDDDGCELPKK